MPYITQVCEVKSWPPRCQWAHSLQAVWCCGRSPAQWSNRLPVDLTGRGCTCPSDTIPEEPETPDFHLYSQSAHPARQATHKLIKTGKDKRKASLVEINNNAILCEKKGRRKAWHILLCLHETTPKKCVAPYCMVIICSFFEMKSLLRAAVQNWVGTWTVQGQI